MRSGELGTGCLIPYPSRSARQFRVDRICRRETSFTLQPRFAEVLNFAGTNFVDSNRIPASIISREDAIRGRPEFYSMTSGSSTP